MALKDSLRLERTSGSLASDTMSRTWPSLELRFTHAPDGIRSRVEEAVALVLDEVPPTAVAEDEGRWLVSFTSAASRDRAQQALADALGESVATLAIDLPDDDWASRSQAALEPVRAGRLVVTPPWHERGAGDRPGDLVVVVSPSMGFGTGHHATTRMCLMALQEVPVDGRRVLDIGTGSGVLALAAARLSASAVVAIDNDPDALEAARANVELNGLAGLVQLRAGDVQDLGPPPLDIVLANLTGVLLQRSAPVMASVVAPGGRLVVSGFSTGERSAVIAAFIPPLVLVGERAEEDWGCLVLARLQ